MKSQFCCGFHTRVFAVSGQLVRLARSLSFPLVVNVVQSGGDTRESPYASGDVALIETSEGLLQKEKGKCTQLG